MDPSAPSQQAENEAQLARILRDVPAWFDRLLPKRIVDEGGPFVCLVQMRAKEGMADTIIELMTAVHEETDRDELEVYAHRILQGKFDVDEDALAVIIEYDEPAAYFAHYRGRSITSLYSSDLLTAPPTLSFYRDF